jgi:hypothetical protein
MVEDVKEYSPILVLLVMNFKFHVGGLLLVAPCLSIFNLRKKNLTLASALFSLLQSGTKTSLTPLLYTSPLP